MKSRLSLKNLVRIGLNLFLIIWFICGCSSSTAPTYLKEDIGKAIRNICQNEYGIDVKVKLAGETLWIYIPVEDLLVKSDKPEKYLEHFVIEDNKAGFKDALLELEYLIKAVPEEEKSQEYKYNKTLLEKNNNVWKVLRRVLFSMEHSEEEPKFFCVIMADIKNGLELKEMFYYLDLKKISYNFISWDEYQHRDVQDIDIAPEAIGDPDGLHVNYRNITLKEFITNQITHRIKLKFQRPEVDKNADIDKEIIKVVVNTVKIYGYQDFSAAELNNLLTQNKIILNRAAVWAKPID